MPASADGHVDRHRTDLLEDTASQGAGFVAPPSPPTDGIGLGQLLSSTTSRVGAGLTALAWLVLAVGDILNSTANALAVTFLASVVLVGLGWRRLAAIDPRERLPWRLLLVGATIFLAAALLRVASGGVGVLDETRPLWVDGVTLTGYASLLSGVYLLVARHDPRRGTVPDALVDGAGLAIALAAVMWVSVLSPAMHADGDAATSSILVLGAYPLVSTVLVAGAIRLRAWANHGGSSAAGHLAGAAGFVLLGDVLYMLAELSALQLPEPVLDTAYVGAFLWLLLALGGAPHDAPVQIAAHEIEAKLSRMRIAAVMIGLLLPGLIVLLPGQLAALDRTVLAATSVAVGLLFGVRLWASDRDRDQAVRRLRHRAMTDELTGLSNRADLVERLPGMIDAPQAGTVAVLFGDLDGFKLVNDSMGHTTGDRLLKAVAARLQGLVRSGDVVSRQGGDEFVIAAHVAGRAEAQALADRVCAAISRPFMVDGQRLLTATSVGVALADPQDPRPAQQQAHELLQHADAAMYAAKDAGKGTHELFDERMVLEAARRLEVERILADAVWGEDLVLHYQPQVDSRTGRTIGAEALMRLTGPDGSPISPAEFIPVAETTGAIDKLGMWAIREALAELAVWRATGAELTVSVNVSARQLRHPGFADEVIAALAATDLPPHSLVLELTETVLVGAADVVTDQINALVDAGIELALDDFGTGYSSLAYLRRFPLSELKIDRAFVSGVDVEDSPARALCRAIVQMGAALGMRTVAEGVETEGQALALVTLGCDVAQGWLHGRPGPPADITERLQGELAVGH